MTDITVFSTWNTIMSPSASCMCKIVYLCYIVLFQVSMTLITTSKEILSQPVRRRLPCSYRQPMYDQVALSHEICHLGSKPMPCVGLKFASHTACCRTCSTLGEQDEPDRRVPSDYESNTQSFDRLYNANITRIQSRSLNTKSM
jgi:hypothetical protein